MIASFSWRRKTKEWHPIAGLATTVRTDTSLGNPNRRVRVGREAVLLTMVVSNLTETEDTIP